MRWDGLKLENEGDDYESLWWPFLKADFSEWEVFWAHHVVPLTNRIDDGHKNRNARMFFREDNGIHRGLEELTMANYSVFYYLARSCVIVASEPHLFPEDAFIFLKAALENVCGFLEIFSTRLAADLNITEDKLGNYRKTKKGREDREYFNIERTEVAREITRYRNAFVHFPRLGRNPNMTWEDIPDSANIGKAKLSWRHVQTLDDKHFVNSRAHLKKLQRDLMMALNPLWKETRSFLDDRRTSEAYLKMYRLEKDAKGEYRPRSISPVA